VLMAFSAQINHLNLQAYFLAMTASLWPLTYDTLYAMVDKHDDKSLGIKSSALHLGQYDFIFIASLYTIILSLLTLLGYLLHFHFIYYLSLGLATISIIYQLHLIRNRNPQKCFKAFLNNGLLGGIIFAGIAIHYLSATL